jgi:hypothetical protein
VIASQCKAVLTGCRINSLRKPVLILWDLETASRRVSLKARRRERNIIAKEDGAVDLC